MALGGVQLMEGSTFVESGGLLKLPAPWLQGAFGAPFGHPGVVSEDHCRHEAPLNGASEAPKAPPVIHFEAPFWCPFVHLRGTLGVFQVNNLALLRRLYGTPKAPPWLVEDSSKALVGLLLGTSKGSSRQL